MEFYQTLYFLIGGMATYFPTAVIIISIIVIVIRVKKRKAKIKAEEEHKTENNYSDTQPQYKNGRIDYPPYNEDLYIRKAKEEASGKFESFRHDCVFVGFFLAQTIIGLIICWIPFLIAILSYPIAIYKRQKRAYQMYIEECEEMKRKYSGTNH